MPTLSGQIQVETAGTAVQGPATSINLRFEIKAHPLNTKPGWMGNDGAGDVSNGSGYPLDPGEPTVVDGPLSDWWFDVEVNGEKFCWKVLPKE